MINWQRCLGTYILIKKHVGNEDEDSVEEREDCKQVVERHDVVVHRQNGKHPRNAEQWQQH